MRWRSSAAQSDTRAGNEVRVEAVHLTSTISCQAIMRLTFVDCAPLGEPVDILAAYRAECASPGFELVPFVNAHFRSLQPAPTEYESVPGQPARCNDRRQNVRSWLAFPTRSIVWTQRLRFTHGIGDSSPGLRCLRQLMLLGLLALEILFPPDAMNTNGPIKLVLTSLSRTSQVSRLSAAGLSRSRGSWHTER